jgi:hypothetical protein
MALLNGLRGGQYLGFQAGTPLKFINMFELAPMSQNKTKTGPRANQSELDDESELDFVGGLTGESKRHSTEQIMTKNALDNARSQMYGIAEQMYRSPDNPQLQEQFNAYREQYTLMQNKQLLLESQKPLVEETIKRTDSHYSSFDERGVAFDASGRPIGFEGGLLTGTPLTTMTEHKSFIHKISALDNFYLNENLFNQFAISHSPSANARGTIQSHFKGTGDTASKIWEGLGLTRLPEESQIFMNAYQHQSLSDNFDQVSNVIRAASSLLSEDEKLQMKSDLVKEVAPARIGINRHNTLMATGKLGSLTTVSYKHGFQLGKEEERLNAVNNDLLNNYGVIIGDDGEPVPLVIATQGDGMLTVRLNTPIPTSNDYDSEGRIKEEFLNKFDSFVKSINDTHFDALADLYTSKIAMDMSGTYIKSKDEIDFNRFLTSLKSTKIKVGNEIEEVETMNQSDYNTLAIASTAPRHAATRYDGWNTMNIYEMPFADVSTMNVALANSTIGSIHKSGTIMLGTNRGIYWSRTPENAVITNVQGTAIVPQSFNFREAFGQEGYVQTLNDIFDEPLRTNLGFGDKTLFDKDIVDSEHKFWTENKGIVPLNPAAKSSPKAWIENLFKNSNLNNVDRVFITGMMSDLLNVNIDNFTEEQMKSLITRHKMIHRDTLSGQGTFTEEQVDSLLTSFAMIFDAKKQMNYFTSSQFRGGASIEKNYNNALKRAHAFNPAKYGLNSGHYKKDKEWERFGMETRSWIVDVEETIPRISTPAQARNITIFVNGINEGQGAAHHIKGIPQGDYTLGELEDMFNEFGIIINSADDFNVQLNKIREDLSSIGIDAEYNFDIDGNKLKYTAYINYSPQISHGFTGGRKSEEIFKNYQRLLGDRFGLSGRQADDLYELYEEYGLAGTSVDRVSR